MDKKKNALKPVPRAGISKLHLYTPGAITAQQGPNFRKLSSNENLYGPTPKVAEALAEAATKIWKYPSVDHKALRSAISTVYELDVDRVICGNGSDELLALIAQCYAGEGDEVIMTEHGFEIYGIVAHSVGADLKVVDETERRVNLDLLLTAISAQTKIVYLANPANPTGTFVSVDALDQFAAKIPSNVILVIDSAYAEFADDYDGGASLVEKYPNVIMTRTFSKLYGLGGLRVGWAYADQDIIDNLNKLRGPFNISSLGLIGAEIAMLEQDYAKDCRDKIVKSRRYLIDGLRQIGVEADESHANFVLARFPTQGVAEKLFDCLLLNDIAVRKVAHYGLPNALRITIGTQEDCQNIIQILQAELAKAI